MGWLALSRGPARVSYYKVSAETHFRLLHLSGIIRSFGGDLGFLFQGDGP